MSPLARLVGYCSSATVTQPPVIQYDPISANLSVAAAGTGHHGNSAGRQHELRADHYQPVKSDSDVVGNRLQLGSKRQLNRRMAV